MKKRRVRIVLEAETDAPLDVLRDRETWQRMVDVPVKWNMKTMTVLQARANVIRKGKECLK